MRDDLMKTKYELVVGEINNIDEGLDYHDDFYGVYQKVNESKARKLYMEILDNLDKIPELSEEEKIKLKELLELKIKELPERAKQAKQSYEDKSERVANEERKKREQAWKMAEERYKSQSLFKKAISRIRGAKPPKYYRENGDFSDISFYDNMPVDKIDKLYGGKDER